MLSTMVMRLMQKFFSDEILVVFSLLSSAGQRFSFAFANSDRHLYIGWSIQIPIKILINNKATFFKRNRE